MERILEFINPQGKNEQIKFDSEQQNIEDEILTLLKNGYIQNNPLLFGNTQLKWNQTEYQLIYNDVPLSFPVLQPEKFNEEVHPLKSSMIDPFGQVYPTNDPGEHTNYSIGLVLRALQSDQAYIKYQNLVQQNPTRRMDLPLHFLIDYLGFILCSITPVTRGNSGIISYNQMGIQPQTREILLYLREYYPAYEYWKYTFPANEREQRNQLIKSIEPYFSK